MGTKFQFCKINFKLCLFCHKKKEREKVKKERRTKGRMRQEDWEHMFICSLK